MRSWLCVVALSCLCCAFVWSCACVCVCVCLELCKLHNVEHIQLGATLKKVFRSDCCCAHSPSFPIKGVFVCSFPTFKFAYPLPPL